LCALSGNKDSIGPFSAGCNNNLEKLFCHARHARRSEAQDAHHQTKAGPTRLHPKRNEQHSTMSAYSRVTSGRWKRRPTGASRHRRSPAATGSTTSIGRSSGRAVNSGDYLAAYSSLTVNRHSPPSVRRPHPHDRT
jgi:hypothetical protein